MEFEITDKAKKFLASEGYEPLYGARPLRRVIRKEIEIPLSTMILENKFKRDDKILIDCSDNKLTFEKAAIT